MEFLLIGLIAALLFAAWNTDTKNTDTKIDRTNGKVDKLTEIVNGKGEIETIRKTAK